MQSLQTRGPYSFTAAEAITAKKLVKIDSNGKVVLNTADVIPAGHTQEAAANADPVTVHDCFGIARLTASGIIAVGGRVKADAAGKVAASALTETATVALVGVALSAAGADGDDVLVFFCSPALHYGHV
jgi:hypothetical protein